MDIHRVSLKDLKLSERDLCYQDPESEYSVKLEHVSGNVFRVVMEGYLDFESNLYYTGILEMILYRFRETFKNEMVFFIEHISNLKGFSIDARNYFEKKILDWDNYGGACYIGASQIYQDFGKLLHKNKPALLFHFCDEEKEAFEQIRQFQLPVEVKPEPKLGRQAKKDWHIPGSPTTKDELVPKQIPESSWQLATQDDHFSASISMLENKAIHSRLKGFIQRSDVASYIRFIESLVDVFDLAPGKYTHIVELKEIKGMSRQAKSLLKNAFIKIDFLPSKLILVRPPKAIENTLNILSTLFPGKLDYCEVVGDFDLALKKLQLPKTKQDSPVGASRIPGGRLKKSQKPEIPKVESKTERPTSTGKNEHASKVVVNEKSTAVEEIRSEEVSFSTEEIEPETTIVLDEKLVATEDKSKKELEEIIKLQEKRIGELSEMIRDVSFNGTKRVQPVKLQPSDPFYEIFNAVSLMQGYYAESINDNKYNFESLRDQLGILQRFVNHSTEPGLLLKEGRISMANTAFAKLIGSEKSILEDKYLNQLIIPDDREMIDSILEKMDAGDELPSELNSAVISENGKERAVHIRIVVFPYRGKRAALLFFSEPIAAPEISLKEEAKQPNGKSHELGAYVSEAENLKFSFLANISHEIRTPMTAIVGLAEFLTSPVLNPQTLEEYVNLIKYNANSLLMLLNDLIDIASLEAGEVNISKKVCSVNQVLDSVYSRFSKFQKDSGYEQIVLKLNNFADPVVKLISDQDRIVQVLSNLLSNSFKFTQKGTIEFGVFSVHDDNIRFFVRDTGIGIDQDKFDLIFESFKQGDESRTREYAGAGLGLAISKKIAHLLDGRIWVASKKGEGSTFYLELPRPDPAELRKEDTGLLVEPKQAWAGKTFLIVDDVDSSYHLLETILRKTKAKILWAKDGNVAVEYCRNQKIDLVLMDIQMPNLDGLAATRLIKEIDPDIPIIAQTAYVQEEDKFRIEMAGCDGYIPKPLEKDLVYRIIQEQLDKAYQVSLVD
ncbi:MAG: response regulator [Bacteroidales bacterium]|nr:response regulator [Bacteroidales bacterium]MCF8458411.1 response regulator [Bacteroidales bacterium]